MARLTTWLERYLMISWSIIGICALIMAYWGFDRSSPFVLNGYSIPATSLGETAQVYASVKRNLNKECSATVTRYLIDSNKIRHAVGTTTYMTPSVLRQLQKDMPDQYRGTFLVPKEAALGEATLVTAIEYKCNPVHSIWPIDFLMEMRLEVLP